MGAGQSYSLQSHRRQVTARNSQWNSCTGLWLFGLERKAIEWANAMQGDIATTLELQGAKVWVASMRPRLPGLMLWRDLRVFSDESLAQSAQQSLDRKEGRRDIELFDSSVDISLWVSGHLPSRATPSCFRGPPVRPTTGTSFRQETRAPSYFNHQTFFSMSNTKGRLTASFESISPSSHYNSCLIMLAPRVKQPLPNVSNSSLPHQDVCRGRQRPPCFLGP